MKYMKNTMKLLTALLKWNSIKIQNRQVKIGVDNYAI